MWKIKTFPFQIKLLPISSPHLNLTSISIIYQTSLLCVGGGSISYDFPSCKSNLSGESKIFCPLHMERSRWQISDSNIFLKERIKDLMYKIENHDMYHNMKSFQIKLLPMSSQHLDFASKILSVFRNKTWHGIIMNLCSIQ